MCSWRKSDAKRHHFHPHASMRKHAPESNERDYAVYLLAAHKKWQAKRHMTHVAGEEGLSLIDPPFISKTTVSLWQQSAETTLKLVRSSVFLVKKSLEKVLRLWHNWCIKAHPDTHEHKPPHPCTPLCRSDRMHDRNEALLWATLTDSTFYNTKAGSNAERKKKLNWVWVQGQCGAVWTKVGDLPKSIYQLREKAPLSQPLQSFWKDGFL